MEGVCLVTFAVNVTQHIQKRISYKYLITLVRVWSVATSGPGQFAEIDETMNSALFGHQFATSSWELKCIWVLHHNKDQKHISKSTSEWIKMKVLEWTWIWVKCRYRAVYSWNISNVLNYSKSFITGYRKWIWVKRVRSQRTKASIRRRFTAVKRGHEHDKNSTMLYMKNNKLL